MHTVLPPPPRDLCIEFCGLATRGDVWINNSNNNITQLCNMILIICILVYIKIYNNAAFVAINFTIEKAH